MALGVSEESGVRIVEGTFGEPLMRRPQDATLLLQACFSARVRGALLYPENLTSQFFDLLWRFSPRDNARQPVLEG
jgi:hypothetical protein